MVKIIMKRKKMEKPDFIEVYEGVFSKEYCEELIAFFDEYQATGMTESRRDIGIPSLSQEDNACFISSIDILRINGNLAQTFNDEFWSRCYPKYKEKFGILEDFQNHSIIDIKFQKTEPGQGYHSWHCESMSKDTSNRIMVYTVYLNDDYEAGETEFLYQQKRIKGKQGDVCIFPAFYTHTHRGNPPMKSNKYILTGWVEF